jgi:hypothetical protein
MHSFWHDATSDLSTEQLNYTEREGVLPITFSLLHYVCGEDRNVSAFVYDEPMVWTSGNWAERIGGNLPDVQRGTAIEVAESARLGSASEWMAYQTEVFARTDQAIQSKTPESYDRVLFQELPPAMNGSFLGLAYGHGSTINLGDLLDGFVFQHGIRHLGEIEHGRALLGLQGVS